MPPLTLPAAHWHEPPTPLTAPAISPYGWHYDAVSDTWTVVAGRATENGRFADLAGDGTFTLQLFTAIPDGTPALRVTGRSDTIFVY